MILITFMEALRSSETPVLTRATWRNIPEDMLSFQPLYGSVNIALQNELRGESKAWLHCESLPHRLVRSRGHLLQKLQNESWPIGR
jgi:hypothetical protein